MRIKTRYWSLVLRLFALSLCAVALGCLEAQDTRPPTEPVFPFPCAQLAAQLTAGPTGLPLVSETRFDTARIQAALNACPAGQAVELMPAGANNAFLIAPITLPKGVTLTVDAGVTVFASRNPRDYDDPGAAPRSCGTVGAPTNGCVPLIAAHGADGGGLMGYGVIDGRGELPLLIDGQPQGASWWDLALEGSDKGLNPLVPRILAVDTTNSFRIYKITLLNSPSVHVALDRDSAITVWGVKIIAPYDVPGTGSIDVNNSHDVTIANCYLSGGGDNVALNGGVSPGTYNVSVLNTQISDGIGALALGSYTAGGISNVLAKNLTIGGSSANSNQRGLYVKSDISRGGLVKNVSFSSVCMQNTRYVMQFTPFYTAGATGTSIPQFANFTIQNLHSTTEGLIQIDGHDASVPTQVHLDNVMVDGNRSSDVTAEYAQIAIGKDPMDLASMLAGAGPGVTISTGVSSGAILPPFGLPYTCDVSTFSPVGVEIIPGPPYVAEGQSVELQAQVFPTKAVPYRTYLTNLKTNPNATLALPPPEGVVYLVESSTASPVAIQVGGISTPPTAISGSGWTKIVAPNLPRGSHLLVPEFTLPNLTPDPIYGFPSTTGLGSYYFVVVFPPGTPLVSPGGIVNAASGATGSAPYGIAQGSIFSVYGRDFGPADFAQAATGDPLTSLGGASVKILRGSNSYDAFLVYASASQINAILPSDVPVGDAQLTVTYKGVTSQPADFRVVRTRLGIFNTNGAAIAQDMASPTSYPLNSPSTPAIPGQIVLLWGTGMGPIDAADNYLPAGNSSDMSGVPVTITVGGIPARRLYAGRQAQTSGVDNVYFTVPEDAPLGCQVPVAVTAGGFAANNTTIAISADGSPCK